MKYRKLKNLINPIYILFIIAFLLLLFFSNKIVYDVLKEKDESIVKKSNPISVSGKIRDSIDIIDQDTESIRGIVSVRGWAFIEDLPVDEKSRVAELVIANDSDFYKLNLLKTTDRPDIPDALGIRNLNIHKSGLYARFSEYKIKPGIYRLGIYIKNDKDNEAFNWTDTYVKKDGKKLYKYIGEPVKLKKLPAVNNDISFDLVKPIKNYGGYITIAGWANFAGENSPHPQINVIITDNGDNTTVYPVLPQMQAGDGSTFKSEGKIGSEFAVNIPSEALSSDSYSIKIMMRTGRVSGISSEDYKIVDIGDNVYLAEDVSSLSDINSSDFALKDDNQYKYYIDKCIFDEASDKLNIIGWLLKSNTKSEENRVYVVFESSEKSYVFKTNTKERKDVTAAFSDGTNYDLSGFYVEFFNKLIEDGVYKIYIASDYNEKVKFATGYSVNVKNGKIEIMNK